MATPRATVEWAMCDRCGKWRKLPAHVAPSSLPAKWYCSMTTWNPARASCAAELEPDDGTLPEVVVVGGGSASAQAPPVAATSPSPPQQPALALASAPAASTATMRGQLEALARALHETSLVLRRPGEDPARTNDDLFAALNSALEHMRRADDAAKAAVREGADRASTEPVLLVPVTSNLLQRLDMANGASDPALFTAEVLRFAAQESDRLDRARAALRAASKATTSAGAGDGQS